MDDLTLDALTLLSDLQDAISDGSDICRAVGYFAANESTDPMVELLEWRKKIAELIERINQE